MKIQLILSNGKRLIILSLLVFTFLIGSAASINLAIQHTSSMAIATDSKTVNDVEESRATEQIKEKMQKELS